jgi:hypothetical protein
MLLFFLTLVLMFCLCSGERGLTILQYEWDCVNRHS